MASPQKQPSTYPVWVGNLHQTVTEKQLKETFSGFGRIHSCMIRTDPVSGRSKSLGYVNFLKKERAENAARKMAGYLLNGQTIQTKGPTKLISEGYLKQAIDYRPYTDCAFFMEGKECKNGLKCPYRHHNPAKWSSLVCPVWQAKRCQNLYCHMKHPGALQKSVGSMEHLNTSSSSSDIERLSFHSRDSPDFELLSDTSSDTGENLHASTSNNELVELFHSPMKGVRAHFAQSNGSDLLQTNPDSGFGSAGNSAVTMNAFLEPEDDESEEEEEDEDELNLSSQPETFTRLLSLTSCPSSEYETEGESRSSDLRSRASRKPRLSPTDSPRPGSRNQRTKMSSASSTEALAAPKAPAQLEPVGLFWDIENCPVPVTKSAFALATKMRKEFFKGKREAEFMCVCDITKERKEVVEALSKAHVTLVHVNATAKNAADDKLQHSMRRFSTTYSPPATLILVSGDINFSPVLNDINHVHNITTILVHNRHTSEALRVCAHTTICFEDFITDLPPPEQMKPQVSATLHVRGLPHLDRDRLSKRLGQLADNCGGKVVWVDKASGTARILFRSQEWAVKAQKRMSGEDVYGHKIEVAVETPAAQRPSAYPGPQRFPPSHHPPPHHPFGPPRFPPPQNFMAPPQPFMHPPPQPSPWPDYGMHQPMPPKSNGALTALFFKVLVTEVKVRRPSEVKHVESVLTEMRLSVNVKMSPPQILWHSYSFLNLVCQLDIIKTAEVRKELILLDKLKKGMLPSNVCQQFASRCCEDLASACCRKNLSWIIQLSEFGPEREEDMKIRSNVVSLLQTNGNHWTRWSAFKTKYFSTYHNGISELQVQTTCNGAVELLGAPQSKDQVIIFTEFMPTVLIEPSDVVRVNVLSLLDILPTHFVRLLEFVEMYQDNFGPLPRPARPQAGVQLQEFLCRLPGITVRGDKPSTTIVALESLQQPAAGPAAWVAQSSPTRSALSHSPVPPPQQRRPMQSPAPPTYPLTPASRRPSHGPRHNIRLEMINNEFVELLRRAPGNSLPLNRIQQEYQTYYRKVGMRVSDILPGESGMRALMDACSGIRVIPGKTSAQTIVTLALPPHPLNLHHHPAPTPLHPAAPLQHTGLSAPPPVTYTRPVAAVSPNPPAATAQPTAISTEAIEKFRKECIEVLSSLPDKGVAINYFPPAFSKQFGRPLLLADYGAKKLVQLMQTIPDTIELTGPGESRVVELLPLVPTLGDYERKLEALLYSLPECQVTLDKVTYEYEKKFGEKLNYCGHTKLLSFLEAMPRTLMIQGNGPRRALLLVPLRKLACEMRELLSEHPAGIPFPQVVPLHKEKYSKKMLPSDYGMSKMIQVLEAIPDVVKITGSGAARVAHLNDQAALAAVVSADPSGPPASPEKAQQIFMDEVTSLLLSNKKRRMSVEKLSTKYYNIFKKQINFKQLCCSSVYEALSKLPNLKLSGEGSARVVELISDFGAEETETSSQPPSPAKAATGMYSRKQQESSDEDILSTESDGGVTSDDRLLLSDSVSSLIGEDIYTPLSGGSYSARPPSEEATNRRLCSEAHRLLLIHPEHKMSPEALAEEFKVYEDPAQPSARLLLDCIRSYGGVPEKCPYHFDVTVRQGTALIQLISADAFWKLNKDLVYLFSYEPTPTFSMTLSKLKELYKKCFGYQLNPAVYRQGNMDLLLQNKHVGRVMKFLPGTAEKLCCLTDRARQELVAMMVCELLYCKGRSLAQHEFMLVFERYFGCQLSPAVFGSDLKGLFQILNESPYLEVEEEYLSLSPRGLFSEQLRFLLTKNNGKLPLDLLPSLYYAEFGKPKHSDIDNWLSKKPIRWAAHVVHLAATHWVVWAPTSRPYPDTRCEPQTREEMVNPDDLFDLIQETRDKDVERYKVSATLDFPLGDLEKIVREEEENQNEDTDVSDLVPQQKSVFEGGSCGSGESGVFCESVPELSNSGSAVCIYGVAEKTREPAEVDSDPLGDFGNVTPDAVLEMMREELRADNGDDSSKISKMDRYLKYFGELSGRELERVEALEPKKMRPRVPRQKPQLAIRFNDKPTKVPSIPSSSARQTEFERLVEETERQMELIKADKMFKNEEKEVENHDNGNTVADLVSKMVDEKEMIATNKMAELALEELTKPLPGLPSLSALDMPLDIASSSDASNPFFGASFTDLLDQGHIFGMDEKLNLLPEFDFSTEEKKQ